MKKELAKKPEIKMIGLTARTNNKNEMNPQIAKIGTLAGRYWGQNIAQLIPDRKNPGVTLAVYHDYKSDEHGDYSYFIGEEVASFTEIPEGLESLTIPAATYQKFTTNAGTMPNVVINAWQKIWQMTAVDFGGPRAYLADFEWYDQRAMDPANTSLDVYVGIKS
jgi:predicted transcriptional regulator YdeE